MITPERIDLMQQQWVRLLGRYQVSPADCYPAFDRLVAAYAEPHRHYHDAEHIYEMMKVAGRLHSQGHDTAAVQLAVWFHDVVYDPKANDNEEQSAQKVGDWLGPLGLPEATLNHVAGMVRATAHLAERNEELDADTAVLLDADLAILGSAPARYQRYAADVRKEYGWVSDTDYKAGRSKVLRHFLNLPQIYLTPPMQAEGEALARANLEAELRELSAG